MALSQTTITTAVATGDLLWAVTSSTGFLVNQPIRIDNEYAYVASIPSTTSIVVRNRGSEGSTVVAHGVLANLITGVNVQDFPAIPPGFVASGLQNTGVDDLQMIGANTATIAVPNRNTTFLIGKGSALASTTLAAPSTAQNGVRLTFTSQTAFAHVITGTTLFENGLTGSPWTTMTFAAFIGAGCALLAQNGLWQVISLPASGGVVLT